MHSGTRAQATQDHPYLGIDRARCCRCRCPPNLPHLRILIIGSQGPHASPPLHARPSGGRSDPPPLHLLHGTPGSPPCPSHFHLQDHLHFVLGLQVHQEQDYSQSQGWGHGSG